MIGVYLDFGPDSKLTAKDPRTTDNMSTEYDVKESKVSSNSEAALSQLTSAPVGRENLSDIVHPHESYEGSHRFDPGATWTEEEERRVVRKTDLYLLSWLCVMVSLQIYLSSNFSTRSNFHILVLWSPAGQRKSQ